MEEEQDEEEEEEEKEKDGEHDEMQSESHLLPERRSRRLKSEVSHISCFKRYTLVHSFFMYSVIYFEDLGLLSQPFVG